MALIAGAQHVTPITLKLTEFQLDSLRMQNEDPAQLLIHLDYIQKGQKQDAEALKKIQKELKAEQELHKNVAACIKSADATLKNLEKYYESESKELDKIKSTMEKQQSAVRKSAEINDETRNAYNDRINAELKLIKDEEQNLLLRKQTLAASRAAWRASEAKLNTYSLELQQKANDLEHLQATQKAETETIKNEVKVVKQAQKAK